MEDEVSSPEHIGPRLLTTLRRLGQRALNFASAPLTPDYVMNDVHKLTPEMLGGAFPSAHVVVFDVEGTLENYKDHNVSEETREMIKKLQASGYTIAINSNAPDEDRTKIVHEMFDELLGSDLVITSYDAKREGYKHGGKPYSSMLDLTERRIGANPRTAPWKRQNFLMVGDQLVKDILAGKNADVKTLYVNKYGEGDDKRVDRLQRGSERRFMQSIGFVAAEKTHVRYRPLELPDTMTKVSDIQKQRAKHNTQTPRDIAA